MLALSASDIAEHNPSPASPELECVAMSHRIKAIASLNDAIGKPLESIEQGNAMIATCFSLLFQSTLIDDGLVEYMTFIRGVLVVSMHMGQKNIGFLFEHMFDQAQVVASELTDSPLIDPELAGRACRSLEQLSPLVKNPREVEFYGYLLSTARALFTSSQDGTHLSFRSLTPLFSLPCFISSHSYSPTATNRTPIAYSNLAKIYALFSYFMSHEEFAFFIDPTNEAGKLLQAHFAALQLIMTPFTRRETIGSQNTRSPQSRDGTTARWLVSLHNIKPEMKIYYEWPIWVQQEVQARRLKLHWDQYVTSSEEDG